MKQIFFKTVVIILLAITSCTEAFSQPATVPERVIIIRHGEKPEAGNNLSCQGFNRAMELAPVLYSKFKLPDYIFVPALKTGKTTSQSRMYQTIIPFAVKYNLNIDTRFMVEDVNGLAAGILKKTGTILLVWEHNQIVNIVRALGVSSENLKWHADDFDSIWIITFKNGKAVLTTDKENLNPSAACR